MDAKTDSKQPEAKKPQKPVQQQKPAQVGAHGPDFRYIVRIVSTDIKGEKKTLMALQKIKGISYMFSNFICYSSKVDPDKIIGDLDDAQIQKIEDVIRNPAKYDAPHWMLNRRKDFETGQDMHLVTTDWDLSVDGDIKRMKKLKLYKGFRHMYGQPVRGQRTRSNFRKNKGKVSLGVNRNKTPPKKA